MQLKVFGSWLKRRDPSKYSLSLIDDGMPLGGFAQVMPRFAAWNYLTDERARPGYYVEARDLPSIKHANIFLGTGGSFEGSETVDHLGTTYLRVGTSNIFGGLRGTFSLDDQGQWTLLVMLISPSVVELLYPRGTTVVIPRANRFDEVVFIVMETSLSGERRRVNVHAVNRREYGDGSRMRCRWRRTRCIFRFSAFCRWF